ncbi:MAG: transporter substrate-binding domain-containing protein [bacterium]|nr:transporter substrate-binding domain-containing protein [bacterium]
MRPFVLPVIILSLIMLCYFSTSYARDKPLIVLAGDNNLPPFEYLDPRGNPRGLVIDIIREISRELDLPIEIRLMEWSKALTLLEKGKVDGCEWMRITESRQKLYDFVPILENFSIIVVPKGSQIRNFSYLANKKVACQERDVSYDYLIRYAKVITKENQLEVLRAVLNREVTAGIVNYYFARWVISKEEWQEELEILPDKLFTNYNGIALPKGSPYVSVLNEGIKALKAKGIFDKIVNRWIGEEPRIRERLAQEEKSSIIFISIAISSTIIILLLLLSWIYFRMELKRQTTRVRWLLKEERERYNELATINEFLRKSATVNDSSVLKDIFVDALRDILPNSTIRIFRKLDSYCYLWASYPKEELYSVKEDDIKIRCPIRIGGEIFGYLNVNPDIPDNRIEAVRVIVSEFENILKGIEDREKLLRMERLSSLVERFSQLETLKERNLILQDILEEIIYLVKADAGSIMILNEDDNKLYIETTVGLPKDIEKTVILELNEGLAGWVAVNKTPLITEDTLKDPRYKDFPSVLKIRSSIVFPIIHKEQLIGVLNINTIKDYKKFNREDVEIIDKIIPILANIIESGKLEKEIEILNREILVSLVSAIEARDPYTKGHSEEVSMLSVLLGKALKLSEEDIRLLEIAGYLHDMGKLKVPDNILQKPGKLTEEEWEIMKQHSVWGAEMLGKISALKGIDKIVRHHHERCDGKGYPDGLSGEEIPFLSRILGLCDSFQAMTSDRPYRKGLTIDQAIEELKNEKGRHFDPYLVDVFIESVVNISAISR